MPTVSDAATSEPSNATMLNAIMAQLQKMQFSFDSGMRTLETRFSGEIAGVRSDIKDIDRRLQVVEARPALSGPSHCPSGVLPGGQDPGPPAAKRAREAGASTTASSSAQSSSDIPSSEGALMAQAEAALVKYRLWVTGIREKKLAKQLQDIHAQVVAPRMTEEERKVVKIRTFNVCNNYSIDFPSEERALAFLGRVKNEPLVWQVPGSDDTRRLVIRRDATIEERRIKQFLSVLWRQVLEVAKGQPGWDENCRLGTTGRGGTLFLHNGQQIWELFAMRRPMNSGSIHNPAPQPYVVKPCSEQLAVWGINTEAAEAMVQVAYQEAAH